MESGDGLIVRLKLTGGILPLDLAMKIADWSSRFGNGEIDLTARANLQIRGVTDATLPGLQDAIAEAGLLDDNPDGEAIRNVIASPLAGLDPDAVLDIRPVVAALEAQLANDTSLYALPAKFCVAVDDGGRFGLGDVRADVRFEAVAGPAFAIRLDGALDDALGPCRPDDVPDVAAGLAGAFLARQGDARRMRDLVGRIGVAGVANGLGLAHNSKAPPPLRGRSAMQSIDGWGVQVPLSRSHRPGAGSTPHLDLRSHLPLKREGVVIEVGLPFGRISGGNLEYFAKQTASVGATELRLALWRAILVACPSKDAATHLAQTLTPEAFILDPTDPRRRVAACVGAPACQRATTSVRADAGRFAPLLAETQFLHLSGCAKGCAHPRPAPVTLVGNDGRYDLICDGAPSDSPGRQGLTLDEAAAYLREMKAMQIQGPQS
jgi:precorrin-3B synthase